MRRLKILWFWIIPWGFIKQRCHYLAEGLSRYHDLTIVYQKVSYEALEKVPSSLKFKKVRALPFEQGSTLISAHVASLMWYFQVARDLKVNDMIWFSHPYLFEVVKYVPLKRKLVVYDCADDVLEFSSVAADPNARKVILSSERKLIQRSNVTFVSSFHLKSLLLERHSVDEDKIFVVNNAVDSAFLVNSDSAEKLPESMEKFFNFKVIKLVYIGAIAEWLDIELILKSLNAFKEIHYFFVGHLYKPLPFHERIHYLGKVKHSLLPEIMRRSDALIMPFKLNRLILAVDPIKMYEYISANKPIIAIAYPEVERFKEFVYFYRNIEEYFTLLKKCIMKNLPPKGGGKQRANFIERNTWEKRVEQVLRILSAVLERNRYHA